MRLCTLDRLVLQSIDETAGGWEYPLAIRKRVSERLGRRRWWDQVSIGSIYMSLERMEEKGYLGSQREACGAERGWRPRRYYFLTVDGVVALEKMGLRSNK